MPYRLTPLQTDYFYHIFNRGVEKRKIFNNNSDYQRFLDTLYYYQFKGPKPKFSTFKRFKNKDFDRNPKVIEIICYCLMPNHFHLLVRQLQDRGIEEFMRKVLNSYTKYFNTRYDRVGPLFQGTFKAVLIKTDEQLIHLSRYIHLNPVVSELIEDIDYYSYSSYPIYTGLKNNSLCNIEPIMDYFKLPNSYINFVKDHEDYAKELETIKHLIIDKD